MAKEKKRLKIKKMILGGGYKIDYDNLPDGNKEIYDILPGYVSVSMR